jgi:D-alanine transaminase
MAEVYLNGNFTDASQARISPMDRGFLFADGVYEVIPAFNGVMFRAEQHLRRLQRSMDALQIESPHSLARWLELCAGILQRNGGGDQGVYMQVTRGAPQKRDHGYPQPGEVAPTVFMSTSPIGASAVSHPDAAPGATAITLDDLRWSRCDIKSVSLLPNIMAKQQAVAAGASEAILIRDGLLTEGASTNVFVVRDGRIFTPPRSNRILGGITRELVIELCQLHDFRLAEQDIPRWQLADADEIWISSSTKDVMPIVVLDSRAIADGRPGPVWKEFARRYRDYKHEACGIA